MADSALDPRTRLVVVLTLAFGIAAVQGTATLPVVALLAVALAWGRAGHVLRRLRGAAVLALALVLVVPFAAGETVLVQIGPVAARLEGVQAGLLMATRLLSIVALTLALLAPLSPFQLVAGLRALGLPALMADLALLTLRYLDETRAEIGRGRVALRLRGGGSGWRALPDQARLLATSLIRAQMRAERLWAAMRLRGYATGLAVPLAALQTRDRVAMAAAAITALGIVMVDRSL